MYIVDVNKALIFFLFSAYLDLQSIRDDEATTSKELISLMLWHMFRLLYGKHELRLQTLAKQ